VVFAALVASCAVGAAHGAPTERTIAFSIPAGTLSANLVRFAVQAHISLGLGSAGGCAKGSQGLAGQYTVADGLQRLLAGSGCSYRSIDASAYEIQPLPSTSAPVSASASAPSPSVSPAVAGDDDPAGVEVAELLVVAASSTSPRAASSWAQAESPLTALGNAIDKILGNIFGGLSANACEGCSGSQAFHAAGGAPEVLGANPVPSPPPGPDPAIAVAEPGTWATILLGLGGIGVTLRSARQAKGAA
jgi:hypothetical protein